MYTPIISEIFRRHFRPGSTSFQFERQEISDIANELSIPQPKNLGDLLYSFRYRSALPPSIRDTAPAGQEWVILKTGQSSYRFVLAAGSRILPRTDLIRIKIPDATPEIVVKHALNDE